MSEITEFGVSVTRKIDTGYAPYRKYMKELEAQRKTPGFGTRENAQAEATLWMKATLDAGENPQDVAAELIKRADGLLLDHLRKAFPDVFAAAQESGVPDSEFSFAEAEIGDAPNGRGF